MLRVFIDFSLMDTKVNLVDIALPQPVDHYLIASLICNVIPKVSFLPLPSTEYVLVSTSRLIETLLISSHTRMTSIGIIVPVGLPNTSRSRLVYKHTLPGPSNTPPPHSNLQATQSVTPTNPVSSYKMRFFTPILALAGLLAVCVSAAPTANANVNFLAIPVPGSASYEADLAAAVAYARSAGLAPDTSPAVNGAANNPGYKCGSYSIVAGGFTFPTYTTDNYCNETENAEEMEWFWNWWCGFCIVFDGKFGS
jgi:hypothetical protein